MKTQTKFSDNNKASIFNNPPDENIKLLLTHMAESRDYDLQNTLFKTLIKDYASLAEELKKNLIIIERLSETDKLTQIYNRVKFDDLMPYETERAKRYNLPLSLLIFDIDFFKKVNDTFGHSAGDKVLVDIAKAVKSKIRSTDIFARWGGEEFIVLAPGTNLKDMCSLAEKIRRYIANYDFGKVGRITCSFGCSQYQEKLSIKGWFDKVDQALYIAKKNGRNRVETK